MKRVHKQQSKFSQVHESTPAVIEKFKEFLPEFKWEDNVRLCGGCRTFAHNLLSQRQKAEEVVTSFRDVVHQQISHAENQIGT